MIFGTFGAAGLAADAVPAGYTAIRTKDDLNRIRQKLSGNYILMNDIVFTEEDYLPGSAFYNSGMGWIPVGASHAPFEGVFDGNGHRICNLICDHPSGSYQGLFGSVKDAVVRDLTVTGNVTGTNYCGLIAGAGPLTLQNCRGAGTVSCTGNDVGGLVGHVYGNARLEKCYFNGAVTGKEMVGGIVGRLIFTAAGQAKICLAAGSVTGRHYVGGLFGFVTGDWTDPSSETVLSCLENRAAVSGADIVGGIAGQVTANHHVYYTYQESNVFVSEGSYINGKYVPHPNYMVFTVSDCLNSGAVTASEGYAGGIIGTLTSSGDSSSSGAQSEVARNVNVGTVSAPRYRGGIMGIATPKSFEENLQYSEEDDCAYIISSSYCLDTCVTDPTCADCTILLPGEAMMSKDRLVLLDFSHVWKFYTNTDFFYPMLRDVVAMEQEIPADLCDHARKTVKNKKTADCTADGYTGDISCFLCGELLQKGKTRPALGHDYVTHEAQSPTCVAVGWKAYRTCSRCGDTTYKEIPATGKHTGGEPEETVLTKATCGSDGEKKITVKCTVCGKVLSEKTAPVPATGDHTGGKPVTTVVTYATCAAPGEQKTTVSCAVCGKLLSEAAEEIAPTGKHTYGEWFLTAPAHGKSKGTQARVCIVCGDKQTKETDKTAAKNHCCDVDGDDKITSADARLALRRSVELEKYKKGSGEFFACDADGDGKVTSADARLILRASVNLETLSASHIEHRWDKTLKQAATCSEKGILACACAVCGLTEEQETGLAAHREVKDPAVPATCTAKGKTEGVHCGVCGKVLQEQKETKLAAHKWNKGTVSGEKIVYVCTVCGKKKTERSPMGRFKDWICDNGRQENGAYVFNAGSRTEKNTNADYLSTLTARYDPADEKTPFSLTLSMKSVSNVSGATLLTGTATLYIGSGLDRFSAATSLRWDQVNSYRAGTIASIDPGKVKAENGFDITVTEETCSSEDVRSMFDELLPAAFDAELNTMLFLLQDSFDEKNADLDIGRDLGFVNVKKDYDTEKAKEPEQQDDPSGQQDTFRSPGGLDGYNRMAKYIFEHGVKQSDGGYVYTADSYTTLVYYNNTGRIILKVKNASFTKYCNITLSSNGGTASVEGQTKPDAAGQYIYATFTGTLTTSAYNGRSGSGYRNNSVSYSGSGLGQAYALTATEQSVMETVAALYYAARNMGISMRELGFSSY